MDMTQAEMNRVLGVGALLSSERDLNRLLDALLSCAMDLTNCDAGTLYLLEDDQLRFKLLRNRSLDLRQGGDGRDPDLPPVPLRKENVCALALLEDRTILVEDVRSCPDYDFSGPIRYDHLTGYRTRSMLVVPMHNRSGESIGVLQLINALDKDGQVCPFSEEMGLLLRSIASQAAITIQNVRYLDEIETLFHSFVRVMSAAIDERSHYNADHSRRMARCGEKFLDFLNARAEAAGEALPFPPAQREELLMCVWLHDVGKVITPLEVMDKAERLLPRQRDEIRHRIDRIRLQARLDCAQGKITPAELEERDREAQETWDRLRKISLGGFVTDEQAAWLGEVRARTYENALDGGVQSPWLMEDEYAMLSIRRGTLSPEERHVMEEHVEVTARLLSQIAFSKDLRRVPVWAAAHHELLNGSGYPHHLTADSIPREVRILTILDIFDALVADDRPYKPGMPVDRALTILKEMAEKEGKLDAELVALFTESRCWEQI
ncbi:MAG: GAF domain-containing protein [Oscillospiraceae bacterium]|nr:GAF domain-containing protein [Oscillospiraceae bacterium]